MPAIRPQPGPQEAFLSTNADIAVYGGAAGGGKSFALLMEPLRHIENPNFGGVIFRRTSPQITNEGALWDEAGKLYPLAKGTPRIGDLEYRFQSGSSIGFRHLQHEANVYDWQGAAVCFMGFDELTHFTQSQFFYMLSRNRSTCGVRPYVRATCNPDADSWVAKLIEWWIDQRTGLPIMKRSGVLRWFVRVSNELVWADSAEEMEAICPGVPPKSLTFIPASLADNKALTTADPGYLANLMALPTVERERLLGGNWKVRPDGGNIIKSTWWKPWTEKPPKPDMTIVSLDLAYTEKDENDPSACTVWDVIAGDNFRSKVLLSHAWSERLEFPSLIEKLLKTCKAAKLPYVPVRVLIEAKGPGLSVIQELRRRVPDLPIYSVIPKGDKVSRAYAVTAMFKEGVVHALAKVHEDKPVFDAFAQMVIDECAAFDLGAHDDLVDTTTMALRHIRDLGVELFAEDAPPDAPLVEAAPLY
jgi:predicted phage terminase large subunit-like protein